MSRPAVSLIIANWNGRHYLPACLDALAVQTLADHEVVLVDNASADGSVELVRQAYPWVRLIENRANVGFAVANNQALAHCRGHAIGLLNNDTAAAPDWLATLVAALAAHPRAAGACGTVVSLDDPGRVIFTTPKVDARSAAAVWVNQAAPLTAVDTLSGNSMLVRRAVIDHIGFLDPAYGAYYEETDWCARALRAGYDLLYVPEAVVAHKQMGSAAGNFHAYQMARNRLRFALKNFDAAALPLFFLLYGRDVVRIITRSLCDGHPEQAATLARALLWNARHLPATLAARRRDLARLGPRRRSYYRSLPLRAFVSDGRGGLRPPLAG